MFQRFLFALALGLIVPAGQFVFAEDNIDFSSPKAKYCFSKEQFSKGFPVIDIQSVSSKQQLTAEELEKTLLNGNRVKFPATKFCDGNSTEDCSECYQAVKTLLEDKVQSFRNSGYSAPKDKKRLLVVGAGPGGLRAAIEGAMMGYDVSILEARPDFARGKNIGMFSEEMRFIASIGMPASMLTRYVAYFSEEVIADKPTMPLKVKQNFLWQLLQKLGATTYLGCEISSSPSVHFGQVEVLAKGKGCLKHQNGNESVLTENFEMGFDRIIVANGARSTLRDVILNAKKITFNEMAMNLIQTGHLVKESVLEPETSERKYYNFWLEPKANGTGGFENLVKYLSSGKKVRMDYTVFVGDANSDIFRKRVAIPNVNPFSIGSNWAVLPMSKLVWDDSNPQNEPKAVENRWHFEGNFPFTVKVGDKDLNVKEDIVAPYLKDKETRKELLHRLSRGIFSLFSNEGKVDEEAYQKFMSSECTKDNMIENSLTVFSMDELKTTLTDLTGNEMTMAGKLDNSNSEYFIIGDAFSDPWYSFGIGQHDATMGVRAIHKALASETVYSKEAKQEILNHENIMRRRVIQVLVHMYNASDEEPSEIMRGVLEKLYNRQ